MRGILWTKGSSARFVSGTRSPDPQVSVALPQHVSTDKES